MNISVEIINQLNDNYSYLISSNGNNSGIIIDPAESNKILDVLKKKISLGLRKKYLVAILI